MVDVPQSFLDRMARVYGDAGSRWIADIPRLVDELENEWGIRIGRPVSNLTYNFVVAAEDFDGVPLIAKLSPNPEESRREATAMAAFDGNGAARLLRHDAARSAMLLEGVEPADDLRPIPDPGAALIAADVLERLWQAEPREGLVDLAEWTRVLERFSSREHPIPTDIFDRARQLRSDLLIDPPERVTLHGDLHHTNVLRSEKRGWLAIDPKGVTGEKAFDVLMFLLNPEPLPWEQNRRRIEVFVERLNLDRQRVLAWCYVQSVVSACWTVEDRETGWEGALRLAEALSAELKA